MIVSARAALLQALVDGEGYGYELIERIRTRTRGRVVLLTGNVYPALKALEREGLVSARWVPPPADRGGRARVYYKINLRGKKTAAREREAVGDLFFLTKASTS